MVTIEGSNNGNILQVSYKINRILKMTKIYCYIICHKLFIFLSEQYIFCYIAITSTIANNNFIAWIKTLYWILHFTAIPPLGKWLSETILLHRAIGEGSRYRRDKLTLALIPNSQLLGNSLAGDSYKDRFYLLLKLIVQCIFYVIILPSITMGRFDVILISFCSIYTGIFIKLCLYIASRVKARMLCSFCSFDGLKIDETFNYWLLVITVSLLFHCSTK